jgi:hypothetical protein
MRYFILYGRFAARCCYGVVLLAATQRGRCGGWGCRPQNLGVYLLIAHTRYTLDERVQNGSNTAKGMCGVGGLLMATILSLQALRAVTSRSPSLTSTTLGACSLATPTVPICSL